jgi:hypothetical protein
MASGEAESASASSAVCAPTGPAPHSISIAAHPRHARKTCMDPFMHE